MDIAIIKYNAGNVESVQNALNRLGAHSVVTDDPSVILTADKVIFPGVGHAKPAMEYLLDKKLDKLIVSLTQPVLGICLGMQLMCSHSEEADTDCLNIFETDVKLFKDPSLKVPQVGWNNITSMKSVLFDALPSKPYVYFVHSYYAEISNSTIAEADYIIPYSAALKNKNFYGVQFHPEKSGIIGEQLLKNFLGIQPS